MQATAKEREREHLSESQIRVQVYAGDESDVSMRRREGKGKAHEDVQGRARACKDARTGGQYTRTREDVMKRENARGSTNVWLVI